MIFLTSASLRAGVVEGFWNSRKSALTSLWSSLSMTMASWDMAAPGVDAVWDGAGGASVQPYPWRPGTNT